MAVLFRPSVSGATAQVFANMSWLVATKEPMAHTQVTTKKILAKSGNAESQQVETVVFGEQQSRTNDKIEHFQLTLLRNLYKILASCL